MAQKQEISPRKSIGGKAPRKTTAGKRIPSLAAKKIQCFKKNQKKKRKRLDRVAANLLKEKIKEMDTTFKELFERLESLDISHLNTNQQSTVRSVITGGIQNSNKVLNSMVSHAYDDVYEVQSFRGIKIENITYVDEDMTLEEREQASPEDVLMIYVKWKDYSHAENTWEPMSALTECHQIMSTFMSHLLNLPMFNFRDGYIMDEVEVMPDSMNEE